MYQIDNATAVATRPAASAAGTAGWFTDGSPSTGVPATILPAEFMNMLMAEYLSILSSAGIAPSKTNSAQLLQALIGQGMQAEQFNSAIATGTADAIVGAFTPAIAASTLAIGVVTLTIWPTAANATTTPTFTPNNGVIAPATIVKGNNQALAPGDIAGANHPVVVMWSPALSKWVLLNPATGVNNTTPLIRAIVPVNYTVTGAIAAVDMNRPLVCYPVVPITLTLPTGTTAGQSISITNNAVTAGAFITLAGPGSQRLYFQGIANQASIVLGLGDSVTLVFDGGVAWVQQSGASQFGIGQSIQTGTTSTSTPASGTTYTNITGKTIYVWVTSPVNSLAASTYQFSVNTGVGLVAVDTKVVGQSGSGVTSQMTVGGPVPPLASYMASVQGGVSSWKELR